MKPYLDIINHFGIRNQMKKTNEEIYELLEAICDYENLVSENESSEEPVYTAGELKIFREHIIEELGDVLILLTQFIAKYEIEKTELDSVMDFKLERTQDRIKIHYYE